MCQRYRTGNKAMKKMLLILGVLMTGVMLTAFVSNKHVPNVKESGNDWIYYTSVKAWYSETEYTTLYIWYKEGNGVRVYGYVNSTYYSKNTTPGWQDVVETNRLYHSKECHDFRRNYRFLAGYKVFNADLPKMK